MRSGGLESNDSLPARLFAPGGRPYAGNEERWLFFPEFADYPCGMGFRFRKRVKLLPGLYWNIGGKRSSMSVKIGGLTKNFSSRGTKTTVSLRGTGLSYSSFKSKRKQDTASLPPPFPSQPRQKMGLLGFLSLTGIFVFGVFVVVVGSIGTGSNAIPTKNPEPVTPASIASPTGSEARQDQPQVAQAPVAIAPSISPEPKPLSDSAYHGTADTAFGQYWVTVDGKTIQGITLANPAPGGQVAILYSDGGKNVPASSLPQGFLDAWKITPERLKAADNY